MVQELQRDGDVRKRKRKGRRGGGAYIEAMSTSGGAHVLVFPYPAQGHMIPLLDFSYLLSARGLSVTILVTPKNIPILSPLLSKCPSIQTLVLPFPEHPSIPSGVENVKDLPIGGFLSMMYAMSKLHDPILRWFRAHPSPPVAIISDFFLGWTHHLASQLGIPRVNFCPSGAFALAFVNRLWSTMPKLPDASDQNFVVSFPEIPNSPNYPWWQISPVFRSYKKGDPEREFIRDGMLANLMSWGVVYNSFTELESEYLEYMRKELGHPRVWAVGPLLPSEEVGAKERGGSGSVRVEEIMSWLDTCTEGSVVYVCFGSQAVLTRPQMEALAEGLEASGARFVWCVKGATRGHLELGQSEAYGVVPSGFEERVKGRGLVIRGWAPQVDILNHRAIGAFLTHCGWNSVLESIVAGVQMLTWAMTADQYINATLLVDQLGVATRVCEGVHVIPNSAELARAVSESVSETQLERGRAKELSRAALDAVQEGGSSFRDIDELVNELSALNAKRKELP